MAKLPDLFVNAVATWDGKALSKGQKQIGGFDKSVKKLAKVFAGTFGVTAIAAFGKASVKAGSGASKAENADVIRLSEKLADTLGADVKIAANKRGSGKLTISFDSLDQLDGLIERFFD